MSWPQTDEETAATRIGLWARPRTGALWGGVWLVYLIPAFVEAIGADRAIAERVAGTLLLAAFTTGYLALMLVVWDRAAEDDSPKNRWGSTMDPTGVRIAIALVVLSIASIAVVGAQGVATAVFLAPVASSLLPGRRAPLGIAATVVAVVVGELVAVRHSGPPVDLGGVLSTAFAATMAGFITLGVRRMRLVMWELHVTQQTASRVATAEERVRIARDLHDVLGHGLTVISMRAQLAARLVDLGDTERAGEEIRAVEELSRSAMADVRQAVAGYRVRPFAAELAAAEATLGDAGLTVEVERSTEELPPAGEEALGFVVREGVTNVLRHARARRCAISVRHTPASVVLEFADDGRGLGTPLHEIAPAATEGAGDGNGLRGLAERLAAAGGRLSAGDGPSGGFVLRAEVAR